MDNWNNSIREVVGQDATKLSHEYIKQQYQNHVALMGGVVEGEEIAKDGWTELDVYVAA
jgi:hypothetical protein